MFHLQIFTSAIPHTIGHHFTFINPHINDTGYGAYGLLGPIRLHLVPLGRNEGGQYWQMDRLVCGRIPMGLR